MSQRRLTPEVSCQVVPAPSTSLVGLLVKAASGEGIASSAAGLGSREASSHLMSCRASPLSLLCAGGQAYYVIKAAQEREELQREGDALDASIQTAEREVRGLEATLAKLNLVNTDMGRSFRSVKPSCHPGPASHWLSPRACLSLAVTQGLPLIGCSHPAGERSRVIALQNSLKSVHTCGFTRVDAGVP